MSELEKKDMRKNSGRRAIFKGKTDVVHIMIDEKIAKRITAGCKKLKVNRSEYVRLAIREFSDKN